MELTLIPIAAILLLLTGLRTPAQPPEVLGSAAVLSFWLVRDRAGLVQRRATRGIQHRQRRGLQELRVAHGRLPEALSLCCKIAGRRLERALFRSRFGVVSGAYRAMAPPRFA